MTMNNEGLDRHDLYYSKADYSRMRLAIQKSVVEVREMASAGVPISYSGDNDGSSNYCLIGVGGIKHLLTQANCFRGKAISRRRCGRAVLQEQARQSIY